MIRYEVRGSVRVRGVRVQRAEKGGDDSQGGTYEERVKPLPPPSDRARDLLLGALLLKRSSRSALVVAHVSSSFNLVRSCSY